MPSLILKDYKIAKFRRSFIISAIIFLRLFRIAESTDMTVCKKSEFQCQNGACIPLNRFCNSVNDCGDNTDEPRFCTPCNRTFYGEIDMTYEMEIHRPKIGQLPFVCPLTFTAAGNQFGDIVQITFSRFTLGKFKSFTGNGGCEDGELQISESERPFVGGSWCGNSVKPTHYFSETSSVKLTIKLTQLPKDDTDYNYDIKLIYRMLSSKHSVIRYGGEKNLQIIGADKGSSKIMNNRYNDVNSKHNDIIGIEAGIANGEIIEDNVVGGNKRTNEGGEYFLGDLISGTYCSRIFSDCDKKECHLESPNFPGLYPRNLTCYYAVRQHALPPGKHALIGIQQKKGQLISVQSVQYTETLHETQLKFWEECDIVQDYVTIYDGYTTRDPILLRFCGGGTPLPEVVSSGPELLIEFTTSPYGTMLNPTNLLPLHGFQLQVKVHMVESDSWLYTPNKRCEFWIQGDGKGALESPRHALPPNTTCLYHLQGHEAGSTPPAKYQDTSPSYTNTRYRVWLSVMKFYVASKGRTTEPSIQAIDEHDCSTHLQIWDANIRNTVNVCSSHHYCNITNDHLLAKFCHNLIPKTCEHPLLGTSRSRPCYMSESYLSSKNMMTLELKTTTSTVLRPVSFRVLYEFVDLHQDGEPWGIGRCSRKFLSRTQDRNLPMKFSTAKNVFLYGRGGMTNLNCTLRFEAQKGEQVKIKIQKIYFANRVDCHTRINTHTRYSQCVGNSTAFLTFSEIPFDKENPIPKDCMCSGMEQFLPYVYNSFSNIVHLNFIVKGMNFTEDYKHYHVEGVYEFVRVPVCTRSRIAMGSSGQIHFKSPSRTPDEVNCENRPWLIIPKLNNYLLVKLSGVIIPDFNQIIPTSNNLSRDVECATKNRISIHSGSIHALICPLPVPAQRHHIVQVLSERWVTETNSKNKFNRLFQNNSRNIIVEFFNQESGSYYVSWLEIAKRRKVLSEIDSTYIQEECLYGCPELNGCINSSLWCDGIEHCPSGYDESIRHCFFLFRLPALYLLIIGVFGSLIICSVCIICCRLYKLRKARMDSSDTQAMFGPKEVVC